jgi:hypothetical protein
MFLYSGIMCSGKRQIGVVTAAVTTTATTIVEVLSVTDITTQFGY